MKKNFTFKNVLLAGLVLSAGSLWSQTTTFTFTGAIETYTVPAGVTSIKIECYGAQGAGINGTAGGLGAYMSGDFTVTPGQQLNILVGGEGTADVGGVMSTGGGGGSFVVDMTDTPWIIAGGGGGTNGLPLSGTQDAPVTNNGLDGYSDDSPSNYGVGGVSGNGATNSMTGSPCAGNGGGFFTNGQNETCCTDSQPGIAYLNGGTANTAGGCGTASPGGFGGAGSGGGHGCGGGGGYAGGGANYHYPGNGGGGGSYNVGTNQNNTAGMNTGNGEIIITVLCDGLTTTVSATSLCSNDLLTLSAVSTNGGTVTWDNGVVDNVPFMPGTAGTITYTATSDNTNDCAFSVDIDVLEIPDFSLATNDEILGSDGDVTLTILSGTPPYTFDWDNDGTGDFDDTQDLVNVAGGTYTVEVVHDNGCSDTQSATVNSQMGIEKNNVKFTLFPNPASDFVAIEYQGEYTYSITDMSGKVVANGNGNGKQKVSLSALSSGTYTITVISGDYKGSTLVNKL